MFLVALPLKCSRRVSDRYTAASLAFNAPKGWEFHCSEHLAFWGGTIGHLPRS
jgi:hypothetical protein